MKKIILLIIFLLFTQTIFADSTFDDLRKSKKTSYLDFILLKIEQRLIQRHATIRYTTHGFENSIPKHWNTSRFF